MVEIVRNANELEKVILKEPHGSVAEVSLFGGQVISCKNERGEELLFLSSKFCNMGALERQGFAKTRLWSIDPETPFLSSGSSSTGDGSNKAVIDLLLKPSENDRRIWPHIFELRLQVALGPGGDLILTLRARNTDSKPFTFTIGLHTYLSVSDISEVRVEGLETMDYLDNVRHLERFTEQGDALTFEGEVDRIYLSTPTKVAIIDHDKKRTYVLKKEGFSDTVVWNPWERKCKAMTDLGDDDYLHMLCVEAAVVETPIVLKPGEEWKGRKKLTAVSSSYFSGQLDPDRVLHG
ncbi:hypothetical protein O6H91_08G007300 [Diphasiastrum complanatum]|uniref:Uncharacterized protein n=1 Tax=Diphasiastrum complanatum TaxID=34168 RepID=A0ACC2CUR5_DIPCM|nr:hypothetical protein O6H91_08G007300 [Diphasiastrum complanatum]